MRDKIIVQTTIPNQRMESKGIRRQRARDRQSDTKGQGGDDDNGLGMAEEMDIM